MEEPRKKRGLRRRINVEIEGAALNIIIADHRAEDTRIACAMRCHHAPNGFPFGGEGN